MIKNILQCYFINYRIVCISCLSLYIDNYIYCLCKSYCWFVYKCNCYKRYILYVCNTKIIQFIIYFYTLIDNIYCISDKFIYQYVIIVWNIVQTYLIFKWDIFICVCKNICLYRDCYLCHFNIRYLFYKYTCVYCRYY